MTRECIQYFASRNGFDGFTSYFKDVFTPSLFTKIFILKGGPGTGKSTLMRKMYSSLSSQCDDAECILCSSDKNSLDGLIIEKNGRRVAFLDGTAPHTMDPTLPVVCEEIVNLGEAIRNEEIIPHREMLFDLYQKKSDEYKLAYHFLLVCGEIDRNYSAVYNLVEEAEERRNLFFTLESLPYAKRGAIQKRLYTSFGKDGFFELQKENPENYTTYFFNRNSRYTEVIVDKIQKNLCECTFVLNSFDGAVESIIIPSLKIKIAFSERKEIDPALLSIYIDAMEISKEHFSAAATAHFEMEKYYTAALRFDTLNHIFETLREKTKVILSIS